MADMFAPLVAQLKANPKTIVFTEGNDPRILEAASKLLAEGVLKVVMVGNEAECPFFNGVDGLARNADGFGQSGLCHILFGTGSFQFQVFGHMAPLFLHPFVAAPCFAAVIEV